MPNVIARFFVSEIVKKPTPYIGVTMLPVVRATGLPGAQKADEINHKWSKYTPSGKLEMQVSTDLELTNAAAFFEENLGKDIDITFSVPDEVE